MARQIVLVRHGETRWNERGRVQGWAPISLNEAGRRQARELGEYLAAAHPDVETIISSDLERTTETTAIIRETGGFNDVPVSYTDRLRERNFGVLQGLDSRLLFSQYPEYAILDRGMAAARNEPELGESYVDFERRVVDYWTDLVDDLAAETALVVSHSGVIRQIIAYIDGYDVVQALEEIDLGNCCVSVARPSPSGSTVESENIDHFLE